MRSKRKPIEWIVTAVHGVVYFHPDGIAGTWRACPTVAAIAKSIFELVVSGYELEKDRPVRVLCQCRDCMKIVRTTRSK